MGGNQYPLFWVERALLKSGAYLDLTFSARTALFHFFPKCQFQKTGGRRSKDFEHTNNGQLVFTYAEAQAIGISPRTFSTVLRNLQEHGFIKITLRGFGGVGELRAESRYALSDDWKTWRKSGGAGGVH